MKVKVWVCGFERADLEKNITLFLRLYILDEARKDTVF